MVLVNISVLENKTNTQEHEKGIYMEEAEKEVQNRNRVGGQNCLVCSMYPVKLSKNRFT